MARPSAQTKLWVTLEKTLQQDNLCLAMGDLSDPLATCLVGILLMARDCPVTGKKPSLVDTWEKWTRILLHAPEEPQNWTYLGPPWPLSASSCTIQFYISLSHSPNTFNISLETPEPENMALNRWIISLIMHQLPGRFSGATDY